MEKKSIGAFIAILRKSSGMTQRNLADRLGVSDKTISHWERDESAPDLTLIPVIAEIFGVTCDEILRGERIKDKCEETPVKTEKQVKHLLNRSRTKFMTHSMISLGLSIAGLLTAFICNFGFNRAYLGFLIGCILWASAIICESVFYSHALSAVGGDDFEGDELNDYKIYAVRLTGKIISATVILFAASLPLVIFPYDTFAGIRVDTWFSYGLLTAAVAAVIRLFAVHIINNSLIKKRVYTLTRITDIKRHNRSRLKVMCAAVVIAIVLVILIGQRFFVGAAAPEAFAAGTTFDNIDDFKTYMETDKPYGAAHEYLDINGDPVPKEQFLTEYIYDNEGNVVSQYVHLNLEIATTVYSGAGTDKFSATVYTHDQMSDGISVKNWISSALAVSCFVVICAGVLVYFIKRAKLG